MPDGQHHASSHRFARLVPKLADKAYRNSYVAHQTRQFLARQVRALRGDKSQNEFGALLDKPQSVVSRLEDPNYGKWTLQTLFDVAASLDRAVIVRIVDYPTFLRFTSYMTDAAARPEAYEQDAVDSLASAASATAAMAESMDQHKSQTTAHSRIASHSQLERAQADVMPTISWHEGSTYLRKPKMVSGSSVRSEAAHRSSGLVQGAEARANQ